MMLTKWKQCCFFMVLAALLAMSGVLGCSDTGEDPDIGDGEGAATKTPSDSVCDEFCDDLQAQLDECVDLQGADHPECEFLAEMYQTICVDNDDECDTDDWDTDDIFDDDDDDDDCDTDGWDTDDIFDDDDDDDDWDTDDWDTDGWDTDTIFDDDDDDIDTDGWDTDDICDDDDDDIDTDFDR